MGVCSSTEDEAKKQAEEAKKQAEEARNQAEEARNQAEEAKRVEAERLAKIPPIIVNVQCNGKPPTQLSVTHQYFLTALMLQHRLAARGHPLPGRVSHEEEIKI